MAPEPFPRNRPSSVNFGDHAVTTGRAKGQVRRKSKQAERTKEIAQEAGPYIVLLL